MKHYALQSHIHYCFTGDAGVFLDLRRDKYLGIDPATAEVVHNFVEGVRTVTCIGRTAPNENAHLILTELEQNGLLSTDPVRRLALPLSPPVPRYAILDNSMRYEARITMKHVRTFVASLIHTIVALRLMSLERVVRKVAERKRALGVSSNALDIAACRQLVTVFERLRIFAYTANNSCLLDSLLLIEFLARNRLYPTWVLGVSTRPFAAHSWVQYEDTVLNGRPERTGTFTPILAV